MTHNFKYVHTPHDIRFNSIVWLIKGSPNDWLGSQMENKIGLMFAEYCL